MAIAPLPGDSDAATSQSIEERLAPLGPRQRRLYEQFLTCLARARRCLKNGRRRVNEQSTARQKITEGDELTASRSNRNHALVEELLVEAQVIAAEAGQDRIRFLIRRACQLLNDPEPPATQGRVIPLRRAA